VACAGQEGGQCALTERAITGAAVERIECHLGLTEVESIGSGGTVTVITSSVAVLHAAVGTTA
jgi:hypothetical protein